MFLEDKVVTFNTRLDHKILFEKYKDLCSDLKHLYVSCTRPKE